MTLTLQPTAGSTKVRVVSIAEDCDEEFDEVVKLIADSLIAFGFSDEIIRQGFDKYANEESKPLEIRA